MGFGVWGLGVGALGALGFKVLGLFLRVWGFGLLGGLEFWAEGLAPGNRLGARSGFRA